jgi:hypothetical protein
LKEGQKSVGKNGKQNSLFPMRNMYITQGSDGDFSHKNSKAIDYQDWSGGRKNLRAPVYAPADVTCSHVGNAGDGSAWTTDQEVNTPIGIMRVTYMVWHDNDSPSRFIGEKRKQGELMVRTGTAGHVTGDHLHMEVYKGTTMHDKSQRVQNWELVFVNDTERTKDNGYPWVTTDNIGDGSGTGIDDGTCTPSVPVGNGTIQLNEKVNAKVRSYESQMRAECTAQGIPEATIPLLALMMVESGGEGGDPMQSSESAGLPMNTIKDPVASIKQGVKHFKESMLTSAKYGCDIWTVFQQYNYGIGYARYVGARGKINTIPLAKEYSRTVVAPSLGNTNGRMVPYINEISIALGETMRYVDGGNFLYSFMIKYYTTGDGSINSCGGSNTEDGKNEIKGLDDLYRLLLSDQLNGWKH